MIIIFHLTDKQLFMKEGEKTDFKSLQIPNLRRVEITERVEIL